MTNDTEKVLRDLFPPLERVQRDALRCRIESGEVEPRVVLWIGTGIVVDGRETKRICLDLEIPFVTEERKFDDLEELIRWRIEGQLLRRNLTPIASSYYRGRHHLSIKCQGRRTDLTSCQIGEMSTCKLLGRLYGVGARTISRDAELCKALDSIAEKGAEEVLDAVYSDGFVLGSEYRSRLLSGSIRPTRSEVIELSKLRESEMARGIKDMLEGQKKCRRRPVLSDQPTTQSFVEQSQTMPSSSPHGQSGPIALPAQEDTFRFHAEDLSSPHLGEDRVDTEDESSAMPAMNETINEHDLAEINRVWGGLNESRQDAFLTQDAVSKRIAGAGFIRLDLHCADRRIA